MHVEAMKPPLQRALGGQHCRLAAIAGRMGQHEVLSDIAWIERKRDEVIDIGTVHRQAAIETRRSVNLAQALAKDDQRLPICRKKEIFQIVAWTQQTVRDDWVRALAKKAEREFATLQAAKQQVLLLRFDEEEVPKMMDAIARAWHNEGIASKSAKHTFFKWLATSAPNVNPNAELLLEFTLSGNKLPVGAFRFPV